MRTGPNKPDSVSGPLRGPDGDHSSHGKVSFAELGLATQCDETRSYITRTEVHAKPARRAVSPVLSCTARGFSCPVTRVTGGGLLPRLFTLTDTLARNGGLFSVTLSVNRSFRLGFPRVLHGMLPYGVRTFLST